MKFTQRRIDDLECPTGKKDALVFDDEQRGLGVRVTKGGGKTYLAQYTTAGSKRRIPLGSCSAISLAAAREAVQAILGDVAKGRDPDTERKEAARKVREKAEAEALTLGALIDKWENRHLIEKRPGYRWHDLGRDRARPVDMDYPRGPHKERRRSHRSTCTAGTSDYQINASHRQGRHQREGGRRCLFGPGRSLQWLPESEDHIGRRQRRHRLEAS
jgi:Arm DNA-binding domain